MPVAAPMRRGTPAGCTADAEEIVPLVISAAVGIAWRPWLGDAWPLFAHGGAPVMPWWGRAVSAFIVERPGSSATGPAAAKAQGLHLSAAHGGECPADILAGVERRVRSRRFR